MTSDINGYVIFALFCSVAIFATTIWVGANRRILFSMLMNYAAHRIEPWPYVLRQKFADCGMVTPTPAKNHSHPQEAAYRSAASALAEKFAHKVGMNPYFVQQSLSDQRHARSGSLSYYTAKDIQALPVWHTNSLRNLMVLIDTDFYVEMDRWLAVTPRPWVVYTIQPEAVCDTKTEYSFTFNAQNEIVYKVNGGAEYQHKLWNYGVDHVTVVNSRWWEYVLIWKLRTVHYLVDRRRMADHKSLILLTPYAEFRGLWALFARVLRTLPLRRLRVVEGDHLRLDVMTQSGHMRSTGRVMAYNCATVPVRVDDAIAGISRAGKIDLNLPSVLRYVADENQSRVETYGPANRPEGIALVEYHRLKTGNKPDTIYSPHEGTKVYQFSPSCYDPEEKPAMVGFMSAIVPEGYIPSVGPNNEDRCVTARIVEVRSTKLELTTFLQTVMLEFVQMFMPNQHILEPEMDEEVWNKQDRPSQRALLEQAAMDIQPVRMVNMMVKKEAYGEPKDPRPISIINPRDKLEYSQFIYAMADYLKTMEWYAFGKTPAEIAARVVEVLDGAAAALATDLSRFDGRLSDIFRELEELVMMAGFKPKYHHQLLELMRSQYSLKAVTPGGIWYETGTARASGSPETACFNSIANAFMAFLALRMTRTESHGFNDAYQAWRGLGIYGGDDGLTANVNPKAYVRACAKVGQKLTCTPVKRGEFGIQFLSRVYGPDVWFGDTSNCCDLPRALAKFHLTVALPSNVTEVEKLSMKSLAYWLTDENTPVIGPFVKKVLDILNHHIIDVESRRDVVGWWAQYDKAVQFPNVDSGWMMDYAQRVLEGFDFERWNNWLSEVTTLDEMLSPVACIEPKPVPDVPVPVVVNDDVHRPAPRQRRAARGRPTDARPRGANRGRGGRPATRGRNPTGRGRGRPQRGGR